MKNTLLYIMDPLCGWCYGFSSVMQQLQQQYKDSLNFRVIPGGMITGDRVAPVANMAGYILGAYKRVEDYTGTIFGEPYLDMLRKGTEINNSEPPCRAIHTFSKQYPDKGLDFAHQLQLMSFREGKSLNDENTYRELAVAFNVDPEKFILDMDSEESHYGTLQDFQWVQAAGINGFPCTVLDKEGKYYMVAQGFQPLETVTETLQKVIAL